MLVRILFALLALATPPSVRSLSAPPSADPQRYPNLIRAELPLYPPLAWTARITGTVEIEVTVEGGSVSEAQVKSTTSSLLSKPAVANVRSWHFQPGDRVQFLVTYLYEIEGEQTDLPENPKIELTLPSLVKITAKPFRPTCSDCNPK